MVTNGLDYLKCKICLSGFVSKCVSIICEHECASRLSLACSIGGMADYVLQSEGWVVDLPRISIIYSAGKEARGPLVCTGSDGGI